MNFHYQLCGDCMKRKLYASYTPVDFPKDICTVEMNFYEQYLLQTFSYHLWRIYTERSVSYATGSAFTPLPFLCILFCWWNHISLIEEFDLTETIVFVHDWLTALYSYCHFCHAQFQQSAQFKLHLKKLSHFLSIHSGYLMSCHWERNNRTEVTTWFGSV